MVFLFGLASEKAANGEIYDIRVLIAAFGSNEQAQEYILQSKLGQAPEYILRSKLGNEPSGHSIQRPYHSASVLGAFTDYEIEDFGEIPYNPEKNW